MSRRRPLPPRDGIDPASLRLPADGVPVREHVAARFPPGHPDRALLLELLAAGAMVDDDGRPLAPETPARGGRAWFHRPPPPEPELPQDMPVLFQDEHLLAVDKPHGLPTTPRGGFVTQTALTVLRRRFREDRLVPAHRLDRHTAGVLLLIRDPRVRGAVQGQFEQRATAKRYEAVVALPADRDLPAQRRSRIEKVPGILQAREVPGAPDAVTRLSVRHRWHEPADGAGAADWALADLEPLTGRTHQLRVHLDALGAPIRWDPLYPRVLPRDPGDVSRPLQLLARELRLAHPVTGRELVLRSRRRLRTVPPDAPSR